MPSSDTVLSHLTAIANDWRVMAITWHALFGAFFVALLAGWRPSMQVTGRMLAAPLLSVSVISWLSGNPLNGTTFAVFGAALAVAARGSVSTIRPASSPRLASGGVLAAFGWMYPHFVEADSWITYTYAAPLGIVPCPTLSMVIGVTLMLANGGSTRWRLLLATAGLLYGLVGVFWLGVLLDVALLTGAVLLAGTAAHEHRRARRAVMSRHSVPHIEGHVAPGFEAVREAFAENFARRRELGGACCAYYHGQKVVDLWGGIRNSATGDPWESDTMVIVYSATKGLAAMTLALAHSRGWLDYEERVSTYWPEFAQQGKERVTVRQLLAHQAGLYALDEPIDRALVADLDRLAVVLARQQPAWEPGTRQAYHGITLGFYESELLRRIDPRHRTVGQLFQEEIASPLGLDVYIRLPENIPDSSLATIARPRPIEMLLGFPLRFTLDAMNPRSKIVRALRGSDFPHDDWRIYARNFEVPAGGGVGTARAIARAYHVFATDGHELRLRQETLDLLAAPAVPPARGFYDECVKAEVQFSLGFMKPSAVWPFGSPTSFGSPGSGGSLGFADPSLGVSYAYVTSQMGTSLTGDPREVALRNALYASISAIEPSDRLVNVA